MRIIINGGGIGGLATALNLHKKLPFIDIIVLERYTAASWSKGAGLNIQPHGVETLHELNLLEEVVLNGCAPRFQRYYTASGQMIGESPRGLEANPNGFPQVSIHRATLHRILEEAVKERLGPYAIQRGVQGLGYTQDEQGVTLECMDHENNLRRMSADIVIGADGIHSKIRKAMLNKRGVDEGGPIKSDIRIYRGTANVPEVLDGNTVLMAGRSNGKLVCYPLQSPKLSKSDDGKESRKVLMNFVVEIDETIYPMEDMQKSYAKDRLAEKIAEELEDINGNFDLPFLDHRALFRQAHSIEPFSMSDRDPLDSWCDGRVVLLGDAAHAMYPVGSNGASSALLDAQEIASSIAHQVGNENNMDHGNICRALHTYEQARRPVTTSVQTACRAMLPEKVMDLVQQEVPIDVDEVPKMYQNLLHRALTKCQAGAQVATVDAQ